MGRHERRQSSGKNMEMGIWAGQFSRDTLGERLSRGNQVGGPGEGAYLCWDWGLNWVGKAKGIRERKTIKEWRYKKKEDFQEVGLLIILKSRKIVDNKRTRIKTNRAQSSSNNEVLSETYKTIRLLWAIDPETLHGYWWRQRSDKRDEVESIGIIIQGNEEDMEFVYKWLLRHQSQQY